MDDWLKKTFDRLGRAIGEQPGYFLIVPILLSALCASGFQRVKFMADPEYLFRYHMSMRFCTFMGSHVKHIAI